jgi:hypothetical protein
VMYVDVPLARPVANLSKMVYAADAANRLVNVPVRLQSNCL